MSVALQGIERYRRTQIDICIPTNHDLRREEGRWQRHRDAATGGHRPLGAFGSVCIYGHVPEEESGADVHIVVPCAQVDLNRGAAAPFAISLWHGAQELRRPASEHVGAIAHADLSRRPVDAFRQSIPI